MPLVRKPNRPVTPASANPPDVFKALASGDQEERWLAARVAATMVGGANALASALRTESDARVREAIFTSLTRIGSAESVDAVLPLLRADDANVRTGALDALRAMVDAVRERLPNLLRDSDVDVRVLSCEIARSLPSEEATTMLCDLLAQEQDLNVCGAAIEVLAEVGGPNALPTLALCQARFSGAPFLVFAIKIASDRILSQTSQPSSVKAATPANGPHE